MSYSYIISYGTSATGPWTQAGTSSVASFSITGLSGGVNYWVRVIAVDTITGLQSSPAVAGPFQTGSVTQESASGSSVTSSSQTIYSSQTPGQAAPVGGPFDTWTITGQGGQVIHNGTTDATTSAVLQLFYQNHTVYHEESNGNSFGTPGWWQWTGTTSYPSATPGVGSFTDTKGNSWSLNVSGNPVVNGQTDTASHAQVIYLIGSTVWQLDQTNNWYSLTPTGTITSGSLSWAGPTTTSPITGWAACASPSGIPLTITGISLSNNTVSSTAPSGTTVGAISVTVSSGTFSGSVSLSGSNASSFAVSGSNLITSASNLTAGNYSVNLTATQSSASNSPFGPTPFTIVSQASSGGPGPSAFSSFLTVDFSSPMNYVAPGSGQQVVSPRIWGTSTGAAGNLGFQPFTVAAWTSVMAQINFGLWYFVGNLAPGAFPTDQPANPWFDSNQNVRTAAMNNLVNNFYKVDPLGVSGIVLGLDFENTSAAVVSTQAQWLTALTNLATFFYNGGAGRTMPNGKPCPVIGFAGHNEPGDQTTTQNHYAALVPAIHAINPNYQVFGPLGADFGVINLAQFMQAVPNMDVTAWDAFVSQNSNFGSQVWQNSGFVNWYAGTIRPSGLPYQPKAVGIFGNIDTGCTDPAQENGNGAIWGIQQIITCQNASPQPFYQGYWDAYDDGTCGLVDGPVTPTSTSTLRISPLGYAMAQGVRKITGPRWNVPTNSAGLLVMATTPSAGKFGVMIVNSGAAQNSKTVALSRWPVNTSGTATANVWQMTSGATLGQDGSSTTIGVSAGLTTTGTSWPNGLNFPTGSVTFISI